MANEGVRDAIKKYSPPWLADGTGEKYLYIFGLILDVCIEGVSQAVKARMPGVGDPSALKYIGHDRNMPRGLGEADAGYAARLRKAFTAWRSAGAPQTVLREILIGLQTVMLARTVSNTGVWHTILATALPDARGDLPWTRYRAVPSNWNWDGLITRWFRAWVVLYPPASLWQEGPTWGDTSAKWGDTNRTWGSTATVDQVETVRAAASQWKPKHAVSPWIIVSFDAALFDPTATLPSALLPDGTWGPWSRVDGSGNRVPTRNASARYWDGPGGL